MYVGDLDEELVDTEPEEKRLIFIPDIEQHLNRIPKAILQQENTTSTGSEMVLYHIPESLSVPREQDSVRKAIIESRQRAREKQAQFAATASSERHVHEPQKMDQTIMPAYGTTATAYNEDAMDTD